MEGDFIEPFVKTLFSDIYTLFYNIYVRGQGITNPKDFKLEMERLLSNGLALDKKLVEKFCEKASKNIKHHLVLNGETLCRCLLKQLIGDEIMNKTIEEQLQYTNDIIKNLFYKVVKNITTIYASSIIAQQHKEIIYEAIKEDTYTYFNDLRKMYYKPPISAVVSTPPPQLQPSINAQLLIEDTNKDYKQKYKDLKKRLSDLESRMNNNKLDKLDELF